MTSTGTSTSKPKAGSSAGRPAPLDNPAPQRDADAAELVRATPIPPQAADPGNGTSGGPPGGDYRGGQVGGPDDTAIDNRMEGDTHDCTPPIARATPQRDEKGHWLKGQTGNAGGRIGMDPKIKSMLKSAAPGAVQSVIDLATSPDAPPRERLAAALGILERLYGKALQPIDADIGGTAGVIVVQLQGDLAQWGK